MLYKKFVKPILDFLLSLILLFFIWPIIIFIAFLVNFFIGRPVLFKQIRPGLKGRPFVLYKFRTMTNQKDRQGQLLPDEQRLTKFGRFLRSTSLDELPELFNVLKGDMSLVGPRPEVMKFVKQKKEAYEKVLSVKPGITDNAAIVFRDEETLMEQYSDKEKAYIEIVLPQKIELYYQYIDTISLWNDIALILQTLKVL